MSTIGDDLIERSVDIHWPDGCDPGHADLFAHNTIIIDAAAETIWAKLVAAAAWPTWYSNASDVVVNDPSGILSDGVTFDWTTFGLKIASTIAEYVPHTRIGWYGTGDQLRAYHSWLLIPRNGNSTYVVMEETGMGPAARHLAQTNPGHMHRGHDLWNISLKFACES
jgi:Polyketide cyclase / dehydrase and lipid transport